MAPGEGEDEGEGEFAALGASPHAPNPRTRRPPRTYQMTSSRMTLMLPTTPRTPPRFRSSRAISLFPADISQPPKSWAERTHNVVHYVRAPRGGPSHQSKFLTSWPTTSDVSSVRSCNTSWDGHRGLMPATKDRLASTCSLFRSVPTSPSVMPRCARSALRSYAREVGTIPDHE